MNHLRHTFATLALVFGSSAAICSHANEEGWPSRPVTLISPFPAGGGFDAFVRVVSDKLAARFEQPVIVQHKPGANTSLAMDALSRAKPDGYTFSLTGMSSTVNNRLLYAELPYDPLKDIKPIAQVAQARLMLITSSGAPYSTLGELIAYAKDRPEKLTYGTYGKGSISHVSGLILEREAGIDLMPIPYRGEAPSLAVLKGATIDMTWGSPVSAGPFLEEGSFKALGITGNDRSLSVPNVPTFKEQGLEGFNLSMWAAAYLPAGTPDPIVAKYEAALSEVLQDADVVQRVHAMGWDPVVGTTKQYWQRLQA